jgi:hypothetical protein
MGDRPIATASMILVTGLHLVGGIPPWFYPITLTFRRAVTRHIRSRRIPWP